MNMQDQQKGSPIQGDLLEAVLARVPLIDLVSACRVSKSWQRAVWSSLLHFNKVKPWLVIHTQCRRSLVEKTTQAYDPRSNMWIEITRSTPTSPSTSSHVSTHRSSGCNLLYHLSLNGLSYSTDPLHLTWHHIAPPGTWRVDPIVALVGRHIIVAGGAMGFEDNPYSVEMYDVDTAHWSTCQPLPDILKDSAAATWLSVAANENTMYVTEKASGITYSFSTKSKTWSGPYNLRPDPGVYFSAIGFAGDDLILAGVIGDAQNVDTLKIWKIKPELMEFDQIGEIPVELLDKLKGENQDLSSISLMAATDFIYIYNSSDPAEIIFFEFVGGIWKWKSVKNLMLNDERRIGERMVVSCGVVGIADLHMAIKSGGRKFLAESSG